MLHEGWHYIQGESKCSKGTKGTKSSKVSCFWVSIYYTHNIAYPFVNFILISLLKSTSQSPSSGPTDGRFALCVIDERGFPIPPENPGYDKGLVVYSEVTEIEAETHISGTLTKISAVLGSAAAIGAIAVPATAGTALIVVGAVEATAALLSLIANILSFFEGSSETETLIKNGFANLNQKIDILSLEMRYFFDQLRIDIADQTLDDVNNVIARITSAYTDYIDSVNLNATEIGSESELKQLRSSYRENFR